MKVCDFIKVEKIAYTGDAAPYIFKVFFITFHIANLGIKMYHSFITATGKLKKRNNTKLDVNYDLK